MSKFNLTFTRRQTLATMFSGIAATALARSPGKAFASETPFKIGLFIPLSGPAALFGPTGKATTELAVDAVNKSGGILGRQVQLIVADAGGPAADTARSAVKLILNDRVDAIIGSCDSSSREALIGAIKGKVPFIFTPVFEGGVCAPNTYVIGDTPAEQIKPSLTYLMKERGAKRIFLIGNDYVWPRKLNDFAVGVVQANAGEVVGNEYVPLGAANRFEDVLGRIKTAKADLVVSTLVGSDNVNFNRTFGGFGLSHDIMRIGYLLEENTLKGIGAENSDNMFSCMSYFADLDTPENLKFKAAYEAKFNGGTAPQLSNIGVDTYVGVNFLAALAKRADGMKSAQLMAASEGLTFEGAASGQVMRSRRVDKTMYLTTCKGGKFELVKAFDNVAAADVCPA
ncbi:substrate-binding domain-containing protein [Rhizobium sp. 16-449-1b]|uniref:substrate-binding domain-containing protein n=1 Tax=Rhizobium sp. 16-449-1b TaxID=2819989 RepID=UPI001ADC1605|nr:substrate-binding domain-containing protein [Rhizobium sp. 16-449-1b]MBO9195989.1 substrate-binding domain-containing protein [Rhizobium sp. 16-449-1b]